MSLLASTAPGAVQASSSAAAFGEEAQRLLAEGGGSGYAAPTWRCCVSSVGAVVDTCVLIPARIRDIPRLCAEAGLYRGL